MTNEIELPIRVSDALDWIVSQLEINHVPYQVSGGVAARFFGATREINDIDIDIPEVSFTLLSKKLADYVIFGPEKFIDSEWTLTLMQVDFQGQLIELCSGDNQLIFNEETELWEKYVYDFKNVTIKKWRKHRLSLITPENLSYYKRLLHGDKQSEDRRILTKYIESKLAK